MVNEVVCAGSIGRVFQMLSITLLPQTGLVSARSDKIQNKKCTGQERPYVYLVQFLLESCTGYFFPWTLLPLWNELPLPSITN